MSSILDIEYRRVDVYNKKARREYITLAWVMISHTATILPDPPPAA
jgi:hypothetical protein